MIACMSKQIWDDDPGMSDILVSLNVELEQPAMRNPVGYTLVGQELRLLSFRQ
jgi:hypothetical protein